MDKKIYRILLIAICGVGILLGLQYFIPKVPQVAQFFGIPPLPDMPVVNAPQTVEPLPLITIGNFPSSSPTPFGAVLITATSAPGAVNGTPTPTLTPTSQNTTSVSASATATRRSATARPSATTARQPTITTAPPTPTTAQTVSQPCNNILYPVKPGQQWGYLVSARGRTLQVNMSVASVVGQQGFVDISSPSVGPTVRMPVECDNGSIVSFPWIVGGFLFNGTNLGQLNVLHVAGVLAPSEAIFRTYNWGIKWISNFVISGSMEVPFNGQNFTLLVNSSPLTLTCQTLATGTAAFETITVQTGTYQALKVVCTAESPITGTINGQAVSGTLTGRTTQWFGLNTGLLKMQVDFANVSTVLGITIPINVDGRAELTRFQPAP